MRGRIRSFQHVLSGHDDGSAVDDDDIEDLVKGDRDEICDAKREVTVIYERESTLRVQKLPYALESKE